MQWWKMPQGLALSAWAAPLAALAVGLASGWLRRGAAGLSAAVLVGWALLTGLGGLPWALWAPRSLAGVLLAPALVSLGLALLLEWRGRRPRVLLAADAAFAGWWLALHGASGLGAPAGSFWRVWILTGLLAPLLGWVLRARAERALAATLTLWGGLLVAGAPAAAAAGLVAGAACLGLVLRPAPAVSLASAPLAALLAAAELAGGHVARGRAGPVDFACLAALVAPFAAQTLTARLGMKKRAAPIICAATAAAALSALIFLLRRMMTV